MNTIEIISFIKNEKLFIKTFLDYHLVIADKITIIDNCSTDNTVNIINNCFSANKKINIITESEFNNKGAVCTKLIQNSNCDIVIPLDADELILFDDNKNIKDDQTLIRQYLQAIKITGNVFKINRIFNRLPGSKNQYEIQRERPDKMIFSKYGFVDTDCGFHQGAVRPDIKNSTTPINIELSYLHKHFHSKEKWLQNTTNKLNSRLNGNLNNIDNLLKLVADKGKSYHSAIEYIKYLVTKKWHSLSADIVFETPVITNLDRANKDFCS